FFFCFRISRPPLSTLFPYTTLFRSDGDGRISRNDCRNVAEGRACGKTQRKFVRGNGGVVCASRSIYRAASRLFFRKYARARIHSDRKSTRLNSSHGSISYAVFCLKK